MCCALISIDSTLRSNLSVGLPLDTLLYRSGSLSSAGQHRITDSDPTSTASARRGPKGCCTPSRRCRLDPSGAEEVALNTTSPGARPHG